MLLRFIEIHQFTLYVPLKPLYHVLGGIDGGEGVMERLRKEALRVPSPPTMFPSTGSGNGITSAR
jgi:hypothetical protein